MAIIQVTVKLADEPGELSKVSNLIGESGINILGLSVTTAFGDGILRFVSTEPEKAAAILEKNGYEVIKDEILACQTPHHPGGLNAILKPLKEAGVNVEHLYPCIGTASGGQTVLLLGVSDLIKARQALRQNWIIIVGDELYQM